MAAEKAYNFPLAVVAVFAVVVGVTVVNGDNKLNVDDVKYVDIRLDIKVNFELQLFLLIVDADNAL